MSVPKKRRTRSSVGNRRSHHALKKLVLNKCEKCNKVIKPHNACSFCGNYKNNTVIKIKDKKNKK